MEKQRESARLRAVHDAAKRLNEITDRAAESVKTVEKYLAEECKVGVEAAVTVESGVDEDNGVSWWTELKFCRIGQRFRIAVVEGHNVDGPPEETTTPWSDCRREMKLKTIKVLPQLLDAVIAEIDRHIADAEQAVEDVGAMLGRTPKTGA